MHPTYAELLAEVAALRMSHFGVLTPAAIRLALRMTEGPRDLVVMDIRKMNSLNDPRVLGYTASNRLIAELVTVYYDTDQRGQWGGDEFVFSVPVGCGRGLLCRLLRQAAALTLRMTPAQRCQLARMTGGLVDGIQLAAVLVVGSHDLTADTERAIDLVGVLKSGRLTGSRSTSGARGTRLAELKAS